MQSVLSKASQIEECPARVTVGPYRGLYAAERLHRVQDFIIGN